jgi:hypothetical protein
LDGGAHLPDIAASGSHPLNCCGISLHCETSFTP